MQKQIEYFKKSMIWNIHKVMEHVLNLRIQMLYHTLIKKNISVYVPQGIFYT